MMAEENQEPNFYPKYRKVLPPGLDVNQVSFFYEIQVVLLYMRLVLYSYQKALQIQPSAKLMTGRMSHETDCLVCQAQCQSFEEGLVFTDLWKLNVIFC